MNARTCVVPFVELFDGRLQGVVSSEGGRLHVVHIEARTGHYACHTRGGLSCASCADQPCRHLDALVAMAVAEYGADCVHRYLGVTPKAPGAQALVDALGGGRDDRFRRGVVARFVDYLRYVHLNSNPQAPMLRIAW